MSTNVIVAFNTCNLFLNNGYYFIFSFETSEISFLISLGRLITPGPNRNAKIGASSQYCNQLGLNHGQKV